MNKLNKFKKQNRLTDDQLAGILGISVAYLRKIRYGERPISARMAVSLERVTGIPREAWMWPDDRDLNRYLESIELGGEAE